jgi:hypothetical protein
MVTTDAWTRFVPEVRDDPRFRHALVLIVELGDRVYEALRVEQWDFYLRRAFP